MTQPIIGIIDTDPGCDDTIQLVLALTDPRFDIKGITIIGGNVDPLKTLNNAKGICKMVGREDIPVIGGCHRPLDPDKKLFNVPDVHGESGVDGLILPDFQKAKSLQDPQAAAQFIIDQSNQHPGLTLFVIGPMTNIALAYQIDNTLPNRIRQVITMGGAYGNPKGNVGNDMGNPQAEFNIFCDPLAAQIVYQNFRNIMAVPLDVTHTLKNTPTLRHALQSMGGHGPNWANMLARYASGYPGFPALKSPIHDVHTTMMALHPELYNFREGTVSIMTDVGNRQEGRTTLIRAKEDLAKVQIAHSLRSKAQFRRILMDRLKHAAHQGKVLAL